MKQKREINDLKNANETHEADVARLQKQKKRMQNELDQINAIFDTEKSEIAELQVKLKRANKVSTHALNKFYFIFLNLDSTPRCLV